MFRALALAAFGAGAVSAEDHWAVLVAGSNGFFNYRHQADVCHAYQLLTKRGFAPDKIITMMYDDAANASQNPFPGKLYNYPWPTMEEAVDVYAGCKIDYRKNDVTPDKFVAVLTGDAKTAGGRVLESKADDHVFVYFVDHGGVGLIAFPDGRQLMHAKKLIDTLKGMHEKKMYKQLTFYLETCESGSMFQGLLPDDLPVYAVTSANAQESSFGTYCGSQSKVAGTNIGSCLGDLFSVNWMMDTEKTADKQETLLEQYTRVKQLTNKSHVMQFGQAKTFDSEYISDFQGPGSKLLGSSLDSEVPHTSVVDSRKAKLEHLYFNYMQSGSAVDAELLTAEIQAQQEVTSLGAAITELAVGSKLSLGAEQLPADFSWTSEMASCHERAVEAFGASCGWDEGRLVLAKTLYQLCDRTSGDVAPVLEALAGACKATKSSDRAELVV